MPLDPLSQFEQITSSLGNAGKWVFAIVAIPFLLIYSLNKSLPEFLKFFTDWRNTRKDPIQKINDILSLLQNIEKSSISVEDKEKLKSMTYKNYEEKNHFSNENCEKSIKDLKRCLIISLILSIETYILFFIKMKANGYEVYMDWYSIHARITHGITYTDNYATFSMMMGLCLFYSAISFVFFTKYSNKFILLGWSLLIVIYFILSGLSPS